MCCTTYCTTTPQYVAIYANIEQHRECGFMRVLQEYPAL